MDNTYKERLIQRFLLLLDDFNYIDRRYLLLMMTSDIEEMGKLLAEMHKTFESIRKKQPFFEEMLKENRRKGISKLKVE